MRGLKFVKGLFRVISFFFLLIPSQIPVSSDPGPQIYHFSPSEKWSVVIADVKTGQVIHSSNSQEPRMPASNMKMFVTLAAFEILGPDFRYRTPLMGLGQLDNQGNWHGHLLVRGSGDPCSFSPRFESNKKNITARMDLWAQKLAQYGIRRINGNLYGEDNIFDEEYRSEGWPEGVLYDWYVAPSGGLVLNDSCLEVGVYPGAKTGVPARVVLYPDSSHLSMKNQTKTVSSGKTLISMSHSEGKNDFLITGTVPIRSRGTQHTVAVGDPTHFFLVVLQEVFQRHGIEISGKTLDVDEAPDLPKTGWKVLAWNVSEPLSEIAKVTNTNSQNLYADCLLKTVGYKQAGSGTWQGGEKVIKEFLTSLGVNSEVFRIKDGSGLSRLNRVTAMATVQTLLEVKKKPWFEVWRQTLAESGNGEGSLRKRFRDPIFNGRIQAKTGFIDGVYALSGYVTTQKENMYAFSMIFNGSSGSKHPHQQMEEVLELLIRHH